MFIDQKVQSMAVNSIDGKASCALYGLCERLKNGISSVVGLVIGVTNSAFARISHKKEEKRTKYKSIFQFNVFFLIIFVSLP